MREHKIIITGTMGAGKTTAISAVSEVEPIVTDVANNDHRVDKEKTTVGFDYGEVLLGPNERLRLYGTPGQKRFDFMWSILSRGALGLIILLDYSSDKAMDDLEMYITSFKELIDKTACVIGISKVGDALAEDLDKFSEVLDKHKLLCPIVPIDVREKEQVLWILDLLLTQLEVKNISYD